MKMPRSLVLYCMVVLAILFFICYNIVFYTPLIIEGQGIKMEIIAHGTGRRRDLGMRSFSDAIKGGYLHAGVETVLFENVFIEPGKITQQWFTGEGVFDEHARIRIYIDFEQTASLDFNLYLAHGIGVKEAMENENTPWGGNRLGHLAAGGAVYNSFHIPFGKSVRITVENPVHSGTFWYIVHGVTGYPASFVMVGDVPLPSTTRLRLYKKDVTMDSLEFVTLADVSSAGAIFMVTMNVSSPKPYFMEGCFRAVIDGERKTTFLSSGFEDFFLSAYYFNRGIFHNDNSGLSYKSSDQGHIVAYRFFINDPFFFRKSVKLIWRNYETSGGEDGCPSRFSSTTQHGGSVPTVIGDQTINAAYVANVTSYVWVYEWL